MRYSRSLQCIYIIEYIYRMYTCSHVCIDTEYTWISWCTIFCIYVLCIWLHIMYTRYTYWSFTLLTCSVYTLLYIIILIAWHSINAYDKLHIYTFTQDLFAIYESIVILHFMFVLRMRSCTVTHYEKHNRHSGE